MRVIECDQYSPEWWEVRCGIPTASRASNIITPAKGDLSKSAGAYADELIGDRYDSAYGQCDDYQSAAMRNGSMMEPEARRIYEFEMDLDVREVGFVTTDDGRAGCSPDGLVGDDGGCEIKSPTHKVHVGYLLDGGLPLAYKPQVHWSLVVTGRKWWEFWSYARGMPSLRVRVEPDDYTNRVREAMTAFCDMLDERAAKVAEMMQAIEGAHVEPVANDDSSLDMFLPRAGNAKLMNNASEKP